LISFFAVCGYCFIPSRPLLTFAIQIATQFMAVHDSSFPVFPLGGAPLVCWRTSVFCTKLAFWMLLAIVEGFSHFFTLHDSRRFFRGSQSSFSLFPLFLYDSEPAPHKGQPLLR